MDDLKIFGKINYEVNYLVSMLQLFSKDNGLKFGTKTCSILVIQRGKVVSCDVVVVTNGKNIKDIETNEYNKCQKVQENNKIKQSEMKESFRQRIKLIMGRKNNTRAMTTWAVSLMFRCC